MRHTVDNGYGLGVDWWGNFQCFEAFYSSAKSMWLVCFCLGMKQIKEEKNALPAILKEAHGAPVEHLHYSSFPGTIPGPLPFSSSGRLLSFHSSVQFGRKNTLQAITPKWVWLASKSLLFPLSRAIFSNFLLQRTKKEVSRRKGTRKRIGRNREYFFDLWPEIFLVLVFSPFNKGPTPWGQIHSSLVSKPVAEFFFCRAAIICLLCQPIFLKQLWFFRYCKEPSGNIVMNKIKAMPSKVVVRLPSFPSICCQGPVSMAWDAASSLVTNNFFSLCLL